jgi:hypothetical protein
MPRRKKPKYTSAAAAKLDRELKTSWERLLKRHPPLVLMNKLPAKPKPSLIIPIRDTLVGASRSIDPIAKHERQVVLSPEMQEREKKAQELIAQRKLMVAPLANKMGYQLITNPDDFKTMGRKV